MEDIKNLKEIVDLCEKEIKNNDDNTTAILDIADLKSLKNILNELDRLQKENALAKETIKKHCSDMDKVNNILAKLQKENEELKKRQIYLVNERRELEKIAFESNENYIPKQVLRDKLEELKENTSKAQGEELLIFDSKLDILEELLESEE